MIWKPIRAAGYIGRRYVLRRYFDTRQMMAESDGLTIEIIGLSGWATKETSNTPTP